MATARAAHRSSITLATTALLAAAAALFGGCDKPQRPPEVTPSASVSGARDKEGTLLMNRERLLEQLRPLDDAKVGALAVSLAASSRAAPAAAVEIALGADETASIKARRLLLQMGDPAIVPLVEAPDPPDVERRMFLINAAVESELALRRKVLARLDKLLDDKTPLPVTARGPSEVKAPKRRVCDNAYLLMRRMVHLGEPVTDAAVQANIFLNAPDDFKDAEIKKARASGTWNRAITGKDIDDYIDKHP